MITGCHNCEYNGKGDSRCINCKRASQDDIRIQKTPHARSELIAATPQADKPSGVTKLPLEVEDTLRKAMASFWSLRPIELLFIQHMMNGKRLSHFGDTLRGVYDRIGKYHGSERAQADMMRRAIAKKIPFIAPIINAHVHENGEVDEKERFDDLMDEPLGDLFTFAGIPFGYDAAERRSKR